MNPFQFLAFASITISTVINIINNVNVNNNNNLNNNNNNINDLDSNNEIMNMGRRKRSLLELDLHCCQAQLSPKCILAFIIVSLSIKTRAILMIFNNFVNFFLQEEKQRVQGSTNSGVQGVQKWLQESLTSGNSTCSSPRFTVHDLLKQELNQYKNLLFK